MLKLPKVVSIEFTALTTIIVLCLGTIIFSFLEGWDYIDSLYFSVVTLATIGYGDFAPETPLGKFFTIIYVFLGVGVVLTMFNIIAKAEVENQLEKKLEQRYKHNLEKEMREVHRKKK